MKNLIVAVVIISVLYLTLQVGRRWGRTELAEKIGYKINRVALEVNPE